MSGIVQALRLSAATLIALAAVAAGLLFLALPVLLQLTEWALERHLASATNRPVSLRVTRFSSDGARIEAISIGEQLSVDAVEVGWSLSDLSRGRIAQVIVTGAVAHGSLDSRGLALGGIEAMFGPGEAGLEIADLRLDDGLLWLTGPWGRTGIAVRAVASPRSATLLAELAGARVEATAARNAHGMTGQVWLQGLWANGLVDFTSVRDTLTFSAAHPIVIGLDEIPDWLWHAVPEPFRPTLAPPLRLSVAGIGDSPAELHLGLSGPDTGKISVVGRIGAEAHGDARVMLEVDGEASIPVTEASQLSLRRVVAEVNNLALDGLGGLDGILRLDEFNGTLRQGHGAARLHILVDDVNASGITVGQVSMSLSGILQLDEHQVSLVLAEPGSVGVVDFQLGQAIQTAAPVLLTLATGATASVEFEAAPGTGSISLIPDLPVEGQLPLSIGDTRVNVTLGQAHIRGAWTLPDGPHLPVFTASNAVLVSDDLGLVARDVDAIYTLSAEGAAGDLVIGELRREAGGRSGLVLRGSAQLRSEADRLVFSTALTGANDAVTIALDGHHDLQQDRGALEVSMPAASFGPGLAPADLFPHLASELGAASGSISVAGGLKWQSTRIEPDIVVEIRDYAGSVAGIALGGVNTSLRIKGFSPLVTPSRQILSVGLIDIGLPLIDGKMAYGFENGRLVIEGATAHLADGRVRLDRTVIDLGAPRKRLELAVQDIDLSQLVSLLELDDLTATGRLAGSIPLVMGGDSVVIDNALLRSTMPGVVRYRPSGPPAGPAGAGESMQLLLKALDDFHYGELTMGVNGRTGGELIATMKVTGANPGLYDGYPIELNLNVSGELGSVLDNAVSSYQIPERIRERMSTFGAR